MLLSAVECVRCFPGTGTKGFILSYRWHGLFKRFRIQEVLEGNVCRMLDQVLPTVAGFINKSTEHETTTSMMTVCSWYSEIVTDVKW